MNMVKEDYIKKFKRCVLEYTNAAGAFDLSEDDDENMNSNGGEPDAGETPAAPDGMGGAPVGPDGMGGEDPNAMGGVPAGPDGMGGAPAGPDGMGGQQSPEGFAPQGDNAENGLEGMGNNQEQPSENDDVIEIDDLTDTQKETEKKIDALSSKFEKLIGSLDNVEKRINDIDSHTNQYLGALKSEMEKRNPTPMQRLTMRSTKSAPYSMSPNDYMDNYAPDNYSSAPDNNGSDDPQYKITKDAIDNFNDYRSIAQDLEANKMGLRDILGY